jgi:hypothetical protein
MVPALLALCGALAIVNWFARPDRSFGWSAVLLFVVIMAAVWRWAMHRQHAAIEAEINAGVITASLMIVLSLVMTLASAFGAPRHPELAQRATMIVLGMYFVVTGNAMPKLLPPLSTMRGDPAVVQSARRFAGWTWVITGLAFAAIWLLVPTGLATPISVGILLGGGAIAGYGSVAIARGVN